MRNRGILPSDAYGEDWGTHSTAEFPAKFPARNFDCQLAALSPLSLARPDNLFPRTQNLWRRLFHLERSLTLSRHIGCAKEGNVLRRRWKGKERRASFETMEHTLSSSSSSSSHGKNKCLSVSSVGTERDPPLPPKLAAIHWIFFVSILEVHAQASLVSALHIWEDFQSPLLLVLK